MNQHRTAMPWALPHKGFARLPLSEQLAAGVVIGLALLALLPALVDGRRGAGSLKAALHRPAGIAGMQIRLARHYASAWWQDGTPAERRVRLRLLLLDLGVIAAGAVAGRVAHADPKPSTRPLQYGAAGRPRARAALHAREEDQP